MKLIKSIYPYIKLNNYNKFTVFNSNNLNKIQYFDSKIKLINENNNNLLKLSYNNLSIDLVNENNIPIRLRKFAKFKINIDNTQNKFDIYHINCNKFKQNVNDFRKNERIFDFIDESVLKSEFIINFIGQISSYAYLDKNDINIKNINVSLHQVRQICYPGIESHNSPEGIHRDGADYIVSAFIINKSNISGGNSIIYDKNKKEIFKKELNEYEGIFQEDKKLWHYVEPINSINNKIGYRDILGLDIVFDY